MGGGEHGHGDGAHADFRSKVWSMPGGPYCRPKHWRRNTAIALAGIFLVCVPLAMKSAELEGLEGYELLSDPAKTSSSCASDSITNVVQELRKQRILELP